MSRSVGTVADVAIERTELELVWPADLFAEEARVLLEAGMDSQNTMGWLLAEAFQGDAAWLLYQEEAAKGPMSDPWSEGAFAGARVSRTAALVTDLAEHSHLLRRYAPKRYYRARQQPETAPARLDMAQAKIRFAGVVADLAESGYFERAFGSSCVDGDGDPDTEGQRQLSAILGENQAQAPGEEPLRLWPMKGRGEADPTSWPDGLFYDLVEALHDLVARPRGRYWHDYGQEWDYGDFTRAPGQAVYRWRVNELLDRSEVPLRLADSGPDTGLLVRSAGDGRDDLVAQVLQSPEPKVRDRIEHAVAQFRGRNATPAAKREATRALADVLEQRRKLLKKELFSKDEDALFMIANSFEIRHLNEQQKDEYDPAFLDWVFWWFLATVELTDRLLALQGMER